MTDIRMHHLVAIPGYRESFGLFADAPVADTAVVFVHGFAGDSSTTWAQFESLMDAKASAYDWWAGYDAFFYKYPSINLPIAVNGHDLLKFIKTVFPSPDSSMLHDIRESPWVPYKNLVLVGHSEGAVVIRRALVEAYKILREIV